MSKDELKKNAGERKTHIENWMKTYKDMGVVFPDVKKLKEYTDWELEALDHPPESFDEFLAKDTVDFYKADTNLIKSRYQTPPEMDILAVSTTTNVTTSGTMGIYGDVAQASQAGEAELQDWSILHLENYRELQTSQSRRDEVRDLVNTHVPSLIDEYEKALLDYDKLSEDVGDRETAAFSMRNVHEHIKGALFERAGIRKKGKNKWETMTENLAAGEVEGPEHSRLLQMEDTWRSLQVRLSQVGKNQKQGLVDDMEDIFTVFIDYLYTTLGLIKEQDDHEE